MSGISTHVLDTSTGRPASGMAVKLFLGDREVGSGITDRDGRCSALLAEGVPLQAGTYRIVFEVAPHFADGFYPEVSITFTVHDPATHHHVPLLISPFGFTTYRGS
jgi:5-hydroxyisourate hydrolase